MNSWNQLKEGILQNLSHTEKKKANALKKDTLDNYDPCPACETDLYYNDKYTSRCAILDDREKITGWMCPYCKTEFDSGLYGEEKVVMLFSEELVRGNC